MALTLFQEYDALFYETSAKSGSYITEAMLGMARSVICMLLVHLAGLGIPLSWIQLSAFLGKSAF